MAQIELRACEAEKTSSGGVRIAFHLNGSRPFPSKLVDVQTLAQAQAALAAYMAEAAETGKPLAVTMDLRSGRAPAGFREATAGHKYINKVNL